MRPFFFPRTIMRTSPSVLAASLLLAAACTTQTIPDTPPATRSDMEHITLTENWPYPFSAAVRVGNMLYL